MVIIRKKYVGITIVVVSIALGLFVYFKLWSKPKTSVVNTVVDQTAAVLHLPFEDLTIPYLRKKTYDGILGERTKYAVGSNYTSYLTSYTSDGLKINGLLTIPDGKKPEAGWPAIVFVHGFIPPQQYKTTKNYEAYVDYLARSGFVVFKIDLRGHGTSEGTAKGGYFTSDYVIDTLNAYAALQKTDFVDAKHIGLWGHSMAGNAVLRAVVVKKDIPVAVIWAGAVFTYQDMLDYGIHDTSYLPRNPNSEQAKRRAEIFAARGLFSFDSPFWRQVIPTNYLSDISTAIQLNHAKDDTVVNIEYSRGLNALLDKTSVVHELNEYNTGGHNISGVSFTKAMANTVTFYNRFLK